jgi:hypothetical protein
MPSPESINFHNHDQLNAALLDFLEANGDDDSDQNLASQSTSDQTELGIVGAKIKLPNDLRRMLRNMQKVAPKESTAKEYQSPLLVIVGETTKYKAKQIIESLQEATTPEVLFCTLDSGSNVSGLTVVIKDETDMTLFSSEELNQQTLQDVSAEQKIGQTLQAYFQSEKFANQHTNTQPIVTLSNYALIQAIGRKYAAHVNLGEDTVSIQNKE